MMMCSRVDDGGVLDKLSFGSFELANRANKISRDGREMLGHLPIYYPPRKLCAILPFSLSGAF